MRTGRRCCELSVPARNFGPHYRPISARVQTQPPLLCRKNTAPTGDVIVKKTAFSGKSSLLLASIARDCRPSGGANSDRRDYRGPLRPMFRRGCRFDGGSIRRRGVRRVVLRSDSPSPDRSVLVFCPSFLCPSFLPAADYPLLIVCAVPRFQSNHAPGSISLGSHAALLVDAFHAAGARPHTGARSRRGLGRGAGKHRIDGWL